MKKYTGKHAKVEVDGVDINVFNWEATETEESVESTDTGSDGRMAREPGIRDLTGTFEFHYDSDVIPFLDPPDLEPGTAAHQATLSNLRLYRDDTNVVLTVPTFRVADFNIRAAIRDMIAVRISWEQMAEWVWAVV